MRNEVAIARSITVMAVLGVIAAMYFAKAVFLPLALAILLTFLLAPAVRLLRSWGLPKPPAVILVVRLPYCHSGHRRAGRPASDQTGANLPVYQYNIEEKIRSARGFAGGGDAGTDLKLSRGPQPGGRKEERHPAASCRSAA